MNNPMQIWGSTTGLLYVADVYNHRIRVFNYLTSPASTYMYTAAGPGEAGVYLDQGKATSASLQAPNGVSMIAYQT